MNLIYLGQLKLINSPLIGNGLVCTVSEDGGICLWLSGDISNKLLLTEFLAVLFTLLNMGSGTQFISVGVKEFTLFTQLLDMVSTFKNTLQQT